MICHSTGEFNISGVRRFIFGGRGLQKTLCKPIFSSGSIQVLAAASHARAARQQSAGTQSPGIGGETLKTRGPFKGNIGSYTVIAVLGVRV